jgi:hypothetical protein
MAKLHALRLAAVLTADAELDVWPGFCAPGLGPSPAAARPGSLEKRADGNPSNLEQISYI